MTNKYYVACSDNTTNRQIKRLVIYVGGQRMKYRFTEIDKIRGIEYNVYEIYPLPEPWWRRCLCFKAYTT